MLHQAAGKSASCASRTPRLVGLRVSQTKAFPFRAETPKAQKDSSEQAGKHRGD
jgi:hypothetical protein